MGESKKWLMDGSDYPDNGLESVGQTILHVILAMIVLGAVYTFFSKTEWEPVLKSSVLKTNTGESKALGSFDGTEEEIQADEEMGLR